MLPQNIIVILVIFHTIDARSKTPLIDEPGPHIRNKAAECIFGNQTRELGQTWVPNLGVPIGILYCMKCECIQIQRKRRIVAKVQCRSIKNECPDPTCEEPVLLPGRCCKTCPGDTYNPDVIHDVIPPELAEGEEKNIKRYAALLTDRSSIELRNDNDEPISNDNKNNVVATGRFVFQKRNLYYSFYISDKAARPRTLQFVNSAGTILEEHILSDVGGLVTSVYQNATRKVCGVWKRLPREYRKLLKDERLYVVLGWGSKEQSEFTLSGQLTKYIALGTELFSSLLEPSPGSNMQMMTGAGGTAIVSISTVISPSIHLAVVFNGIFLPNEIADVPVNVTLAFEDKKVILTEKVFVTKPATELNVIEISSPISQTDLRLLTRGRLVLSVASMSKLHTLKLSGMVMTKATCELFQTTLSSSGDRESNKYGTSGLAWVFLNNEGSLVYNVQVEDLQQEQKPIFITLVDISNKKKTELEDLTPSFFYNWANDTIDRLSPKVLEPLYSGNLAVNVATEKDISLIKGRLIRKLVADARDVSAPVLLKREDRSLPTSAVGMGWFSVDRDCHIYYDVTLTGMGNNDRQLELSLKFLPMSAPDAPFTTRILEEFKGNQIEGSPVEPLSIDELVRLDSGVVFVKVKDKYTRNTLLNSTLKQMKIPQNCLPHTDNSLTSTYGDATSHLQGACFYERRFYKEEAQWTSISDPCTMCFCQNGVVKCDTMTCPEINCPNGRKIKSPGDCCYTCTNSTTQENETDIPRTCTLLGKQYLPGASFHPFLIPNGFDTCTLCVCDPVLLQVKCTRNGDETVCCKNCQASNTYRDTENGTMFGDHHTGTVIEAFEDEKPVTERSVEQILLEGGCRNPYNPKQPYHDGQKFHPIIESLGEYKCVTCKCQQGKQTCDRLKCTRAMCRMLKSKKNNMNSSESCCSLKQCRYRRHQRRRNNTNIQ